MKLKVKNIKTIDSHDLDMLVEKVYERPYCFQQQDGCKTRGTEEVEIPCGYNCDIDNHHMDFEVNRAEMGVSFDTWLSRDPNPPEGVKEWENNLFFNRNFYPDVHCILEDLHKKGYIEEGEYTIIIDW